MVSIDLGFLHKIPSPSRLAQALDRTRDAHLDDVLTEGRDDVRALLRAREALKQGPDASAAETVDRVASKLLAELRASSSREGAALRAMTLFDRALHTEDEELLDRELLPQPVKDFSMRLLHRVNVVLGSYSVWTDAIVHALGDRRDAHVYDLAAGTGGYARHLVAHPPEGYSLRVTSSDLRSDYVAIGAARAREEGLDVRYEVRDALDLRELRERGDVDLFLCTQAVHHLSPGMVVRMIAQCIAAAPRGLVVVDLFRSLTNFVAAGAFVSLAAPFPVLVYDGLVSVRRSYTPAELSLLAHLAGAHHVESRTWGPAYCLLHAYGAD